MTFALLLLLGGGLIAAVVVGEKLLDPDSLERRINAKLSSESSYRVHIGEVQWSLWHCSLRAGDVVVYLPPRASSRAVAVKGGGGREWNVRAHVPSIHLKGVQLWSLFWRGTYSVREVAVDRPTFHIQRAEKGPRPVRNRQEETPRTNSSSVQEVLAGQFARLNIRRLRVRDGTVVLRNQSSGQGQSFPTDSLWGLTVRAGGIHIDSASLADSGRILFSDSIQLSVKGYRHLSEDSLYATTVGPVRGSTTDSSLTVKGVEVAPTLPDSSFMQRVGHRTNRFSVSLDSAELKGVDYGEAVEDGSVLANLALLDSFRVDVYRNNRLPPPETEPPPTMPSELFRSLERTVHLDTVRLTGGFARYTKWPEKSRAPGSIFFEEIAATIWNVTNDPRRMSASTPAVIETTAQVAGSGRLDATIRVPLLSPDLAFSYQGRVGPMDPRVFNDVLVPLSGVRIEGGHVDSLWFAAEADSGVARGTLHGIYRGLNVETLEQGTGDRGVRQRIRTFVLDNFVLKSKNTRGGSSLRTGTIEHRYEEGATFLKFLWHSVRSGMFSLAGL